MGNEIIKVLEYLSDEIGVAIDWTSVNALPYIEEVAGKIINWEIGTSIAWIVIGILMVVAVFTLAKVFEWDLYKNEAIFVVMVIAIAIIGKQTFDIIACYTIPEKAIYDCISYYINQ